MPGIASTICCLSGLSLLIPILTAASGGGGGGPLRSLSLEEQRPLDLSSGPTSWSETVWQAEYNPNVKSATGILFVPFKTSSDYSALSAALQFLQSAVASRLEKFTPYGCLAEQLFDKSTVVSPWFSSADATVDPVSLCVDAVQLYGNRMGRSIDEEIVLNNFEPSFKRKTIVDVLNCILTSFEFKDYWALELYESMPVPLISFRAQANAPFLRDDASIGERLDQVFNSVFTNVAGENELMAASNIIIDLPPCSNKDLQRCLNYLEREFNFELGGRKRKYRIKSIICHEQSKEALEGRAAEQFNDYQTIVSNSSTTDWIIIDSLDPTKMISKKTLFEFFRPKSDGARLIPTTIMFEKV